MAITYPGESKEYRAARDRLLEQEIALRRAAEAAAEARRALPPGGVIPSDYVFQDSGGPAKLSQLFGKNDSLFIYSYMFGPERERPCNMCTPLLDGLNGIEDHVRQRLSVAVVAESPVAKLRAFAQERGWERLHLLSSAGTTYNRDYHGKTGNGEDTTMINVFHRDGKVIRHFWGSEMIHAKADPGQDHRGADLVAPIFALFDLTPEGRGDWYTKLSYD
jgi:predicted dithiol-disulfide oxidoreductase (DUF899 family)